MMISSQNLFQNDQQKKELKILLNLSTIERSLLSFAILVATLTSNIIVEESENRNLLAL